MAESETQLSQQTWILRYVGMYSICENGIITSHRGLKPRLMNLTETPKGYKKVGLSNHGLEECRFVHRLVLETFIGPLPTPLHQCDHVNGIKSDNRLVNLRWVTPKENGENSVRLGLTTYGEKNTRSKLTFEQVKEIYLAKAKGIIKPVLAKKYGVHQYTIYRIWSRRLWVKQLNDWLTIPEDGRQE